MGEKSPDVDRLIADQVTGHDAIGITDEYLDRIGWPRVAGRMITLIASNRSEPGAAPQRL